MIYSQNRNRYIPLIVGVFGLLSVFSVFSDLPAALDACLMPCHMHIFKRDFLVGFQERLPSPSQPTVWIWDLEEVEGGRSRRPGDTHLSDSHLTQRVSVPAAAPRLPPASPLPPPCLPFSVRSCEGTLGVCAQHQEESTARPWLCCRTAPTLPQPSTACSAAGSRGGERDARSAKVPPVSPPAALAVRMPSSSPPRQGQTNLIEPGGSSCCCWGSRGLFPREGNIFQMELLWAHFLCIQVEQKACTVHSVSQCFTNEMDFKA